MSLNYSRFDHIDSESDEEVETIQAKPTKVIEEVVGRPLPKRGGRIQYLHEGRLIFEWEQSLEEVNIYLVPPPNIPSHTIKIDISHNHLRVGLKGVGQAFIDEDTGGAVKTKESMWMLSDGEININLQKMSKAELWECALRGRSGQALDIISKEETKRKLMLERFQEEHPGFDFSSAEFNGAIPEARSFMGGVSYS